MFPEDGPGRLVRIAGHLKPIDPAVADQLCRQDRPALTADEILNAEASNGSSERGDRRRTTADREEDQGRRNSRKPSRLVLLAPWLDVSMSDPRSAEIKDPLLSVSGLAKSDAKWAGPAGTADRLASPLFGSLEGLPPTYVYSSSRDLLTVDTLRLRDRVLAEDVPDVTFRLREGLIHDWFIFPFLPDAHGDRPSVYQDLLGSDVLSDTSAPT